ncbi:MAG: 6-phosphogluconolactonase, partial [Alphaproteobacteria bacterium]
SYACMRVLEELHFPTPTDAAARLADDMAATLKDALAARGTASLAVSGGRTPEMVLPKLAAADLDWANVHVTLVDERRVNVDHPDSNEGLARRLLPSAARFTGLLGSHPDKDLDALDWPLDAAFLGMGPDGHIASLFPGTGDWSNHGRVLAVAAVGDRRARISLTPEALLDCRHIFLILSGPEKRAAFDAAKQPGPVAELPLRLIVHQDRVPVTVYISN